MNNLEIPLVLMAPNEERDDIGILLLTEALKKIDSSCAGAVVLGNATVVDLANEVLGGFTTNSIFSIAQNTFGHLKTNLTPNGVTFYMNSAASKVMKYHMMYILLVS